MYLKNNSRYGDIAKILFFIPVIAMPLYFSEHY